MCTFVSSDDPLGGFDGASTIGAEAGVPAIVEQDNVPVSTDAIDSLSCMMLNRIGGSSPPIEAGHIPHDRFEPELVGSTEHCRPPRAERRTKEFGHHSSGVGNHARAIGQLTRNCATSKKQQIGMIHCVIRNQMSGLNDRTRDVRTRFDKPTDEKECCFDFVPRKDLEEPFGMDVVRAVVISER